MSRLLATIVVLAISLALAHSALNAPRGRKLDASSSALSQMQQQELLEQQLQQRIHMDEHQRELERQRASDSRFAPVVSGLPGSGVASAKASILFPDGSVKTATLPCDQWTDLTDLQKMYVSRDSFAVVTTDYINGYLFYNATESPLLTGKYIFEGNFANLEVRITWDSQNPGVPLSLYCDATITSCNFTGPIGHERYCKSHGNEENTIWSYADNAGQPWLKMAEVNSETAYYQTYGANLPSYKLMNHIISVQWGKSTNETYQFTFFDTCS